MNENPSPKVYKVLVDDNYHYMDADWRYEHGSFSSLEETLQAAKLLVDLYLEDAYAPEMTADDLYESYATFGPDPFIQSNTEDKVTFSAWGYAKERCEEICNSSSSAHQPSQVTMEGELSINDAIIFASAAHEGQLDKAGEPYILHPLRVMLKLTTDEERIAAVLHDAVEDCEWVTLDFLRAKGFSESVIEAIDSVTKRDGEDYDSFVQRAAANPIGRRVKLADLEDNCDLSRIRNPTERDYKRTEKYQRAIEIIKNLDIADANKSAQEREEAIMKVKVSEKIKSALEGLDCKFLSEPVQSMRRRIAAQRERGKRQSQAGTEPPIPE